MQNMAIRSTKAETVKVRVTPKDLEAWQRAADADHRTLSDWVRMRCEGLSESAPSPPLAVRRKGGK